MKTESLLKPNQSLSQKVVRGGFWVFALRITGRVLGFLRLVILARVLAPHDFGLLGIALLTLSILETFSGTGFGAALIQKKGNIDAYLNSAWTVSVIRGFILFAVLYFIAPYATIFFKAPEAKLVIQIIGLSILFEAFTNIGVIYFQKELEFNKQFVYQLSATLADFIVAVSAALILRNVWALVFGLLAGSFVRLIVSYLIHPYQPHLDLNLEKAKELFGFGKWVLGSGILIFLITHGDDILVGKLLGVTVLGFYQMAYRISNLPATEITHVISEVTSPAYSKLQDNLPHLREAYLKVLQVTAFLSFPIAGLIFVLAPDFTKIFLGEKWMPMVPAMQALCVFGLLRSIAATGGPIFSALGKPKIQTIISGIQLVILASIIYPFTIKLNILGTSIATIIAFIVIFIPGMIINCRLINLKFLHWLKVLIFPWVSSLVMIGVIFLVKLYFESVSLIPLVSLVTIGILAYFISTFLFEKRLIIEAKNILEI